MVRDKATTARESILRLLESGRYGDGDRLPGARETAAATGMSLLTAQAAIKTLERDGVLELKARSGAFVKEGWREVPLESRLHHFSPELPWMGRFEELLAKRLPMIRLTRAFSCATFEIKPTIALLSNRSDYMDVAALFREAFPDSSLFYETPFRSFRQGGKLLGVPFIFSPRVIVYNPEVFRQRRCPEPSPSWTWDGFIECVRALKAAGHPQDRIFSFTCSTGDWMNFVLLAGGSLFSPSEKDPVRIDSPETRRGLRLYSQLQKELGGGKCGEDFRGEKLMDGSLAMTLMPRELRTWLKARSFESWSAVPLPEVPGGAALNTQATDLLCVRRECKDYDLAVKLIAFLLSEEVQDFIGQEKYGIPIRMSSALKSLDRGKPCDKVFFDQIASMSADYNLDSPDLTEMINDGIGRIWREGADIDSTTAEIAAATRTYLKVRSYGKGRK